MLRATFQKLALTLLIGQNIQVAEVVLVDSLTKKVVVLSQKPLQMLQFVLFREILGMLKEIIGLLNSSMKILLRKGEIYLSKIRKAQRRKENCLFCKELSS